MPDPLTIMVSFPDLTLAEANQRAERLREALLPKCSQEDGIEIFKESARTQDAGSILAITLAAPAIVEIARGLGAFIAAWGSAIEIRTPSGDVIARGTAASNLDSAAIAEALTKHRSPR